MVKYASDYTLKLGFGVAICFKHILLIDEELKININDLAPVMRGRSESCSFCRKQGDERDIKTCISGPAGDWMREKGGMKGWAMGVYFPKLIPLESHFSSDMCSLIRSFGETPEDFEEMFSDNIWEFMYSIRGKRLGKLNILNIPHDCVEGEHDGHFIGQVIGVTEELGIFGKSVDERFDKQMVKNELKRFFGEHAGEPYFAFIGNDCVCCY